MKYQVGYISGVASRIEVKTKTKGYTIGVLEPFFPADEELAKWSQKKCDAWTAKNNKMMEAICKFMNENKL